MTALRRLFGLMAGQRRWIALGALLGFLAVGANVALMALSAYLISRAAIVTNVAEVALAITGVRVLAISRATFRYLERYVTHRATFAILADLRVWFFASIEPLAPARLTDRRRGDLLARIVADIETLEDVPRPDRRAAASSRPLVTAFATLLLGAFDPVLGLALVVFLVVTGVVLPLVSRRLSRRPAACAHRDPRRARSAWSSTSSAGSPTSSRSIGRRRTGSASWTLGTGDGPGGRRPGRRPCGDAALAATFASLAGVTVLAIGVGLVGAGRLDGVYLAVLPLVAVAAFEVIGPLAQGFGLLDANEAAARRLFELTDAEPEVTDAPDAVARRSDPPTTRSRSGTCDSATAPTSRTSSTA